MAWIATTIIGQPLYAFLNLRLEVATLLARFERDDPAETQEPAENATYREWLKQRSDAYEACGAQLIAFAASNVLVTKLLNKWKRYPSAAGSSLITLGNINQRAQVRLVLKEQIISALKLNTTIL